MHEELRTINLNVNGEKRTIYGVYDSDTLLSVLRDKLNLMGTKMSCNEGSCGACTVIMNGKATLSCMTLALSAVGKEIITVEGLAKGNELHPIQEAYLEERGYACGFCTPGFVMTTKALLDENDNPSREEIKDAISGNICRCGVYEHIQNAVENASRRIRG